MTAAAAPRALLDVLRDALTEHEQHPPAPTQERPRALRPLPHESLPDALVATVPGLAGGEWRALIKSYPCRIAGRILDVRVDADMPIVHVGIAYDGRVASWPLLWRWGGDYIEFLPHESGLVAQQLTTPAWHLRGGIEILPLHALLRAIRRPDSRRLFHLLAHPDDLNFDVVRRGRRVVIDGCLADLYYCPRVGESMQATYDVKECWHIWPFAVNAAPKPWDSWEWLWEKE